MPIMDGAATIRAVRTIDPAVKVIAASGLDPDTSFADSEKLDADAFLQKPYTAERLLHAVAGVLRSNQQREDAQDDPPPPSPQPASERS